MKNQARQVFILCNGCQRRSLEAARLAAWVRSNGGVVVDHYQKADTLLFVSCALDALHEHESYRWIRRFVRTGKTFYLLGCLSEIIPESFRQHFGESLHEQTLPTSRLAEIDRFFPDFPIKFSDVPEQNILWNSPGFYNRAFRNFNPVKFVQLLLNPSALKAKLNSLQTINKLEKEESAYFCLSYGCPNQCTYCAKTRAFGKLKSKASDDCLREYEALVAAATPRITFTADDTGSWGLDQHSDLPALLSRLEAISAGDRPQWIFKNFHPKWIIKYQSQLEPYVRSGRLTDLTVPIESGSNRILQLMNRNHRIEDLITVLQHFRSLQPTLTLRTHVMIGFPGETEEDFNQTLAAIRAIHFDWVTFFRYYDAEGTAARGMQDKVPETVIRERIRRMKSFMKKNRIPWL